MKHLLGRLQLLIFLITPISFSFAKHITTFIPRSQGANTARELVGWQRELYQCYDENYAALAAVGEYTRSMHTEPIARDLFTSTCLTFAGSDVATRQPTDILADYFGLATDFVGTLSIKPRIENYIIDLELYFGLDEWIDGLFVRVHGPLTHTKWTLGLDSCVVCAPKFRGCPMFPPCYMFSNTPLTECTAVIPTLNPLAQANDNCATDSLAVALGGNFTFGDMKEAWKYGRFSFCPRNKTGIADIDAIVGLNLIHNDYAHFGFFAMCVIPTGNRPKAKYIFEPLVGNGKHWEAGGGFTMHLGWLPNDASCLLNGALYIEGNITHVFKTHQIRSFDFTQNGPLSRYMLLKEFDPNCANGNSTFENSFTYNATATTTTDVYKGLMNAINFATRNCEVSVGLKTDVSAKACLSAGNWTLDLGYNFWYKSAEKICILTDCPCYVDQRFLGFKGTEPVCCQNYQIVLSPTGTGSTVAGIFPTGYTIPADSTVPSGCPPLINPAETSNAPSDATQANATIFGPGTLASGTVPSGACSVCINSGNVTVPINVSDLTPENGFYIDTQPDLISCKDLDPTSAEQCKMMTHKVFGHLSYTFYQSCYNPHIGIGGEAEFDAHCDNALEQWGIWIKGGLEF